MAKNRLNLKNRRSGHTFTAKPHHIFRADTKNGRPSPASVLTHKAAHLLDNLAAQFNGKNNGDLSAAPEITKLYGWTSQGSVHSSLTELLAYGFIELTRQGGRNKCSLYALTWLAIDECGGKLDVCPTRQPSNLWKPENQSKIDPRYRRKYFTKAEKSDCEAEVKK
jgi:hypothetical protein